MVSVMYNMRLATTMSMVAVPWSVAIISCLSGIPSKIINYKRYLYGRQLLIKYHLVWNILFGADFAFTTVHLDQEST